MKRIPLILALVLIVAMHSYAERVTSETAQKVATTFLNNNGAKSAQLTDLFNEAGFPNLYIFNAEPGFVVMSADDCVQPILGYSLTGKFVAENMPDNVSSWLQGYNDEIQFAIDSKMKAKSETTKMWKELVEGQAKAGKTTVVVGPLVQTQWDQNGIYYYSGGQLQIFELYNNLCPYDYTAGERTVTGCVATAMAQIMKFWGYPSQGIGSHSYTPLTRPDLGVQSANFGETTYQWADMPNKLSMSSTTTQINAVATLMYHCGVSVDMMYNNINNGGSGAYSADIPYALNHYFNYKATANIKYRNSYSTTVWMNMLKTDLDAGRPIQYSGSGTGGHAFICDGYDSSNKFHFNWGWSGNNDGYFELSNLNPGSGGAGGGGYVFNNDQSAVFGIEPVQCAASNPTNLSYIMTGLNNITLNWTAADGAASYNIYRNNNYVGNSTTNSYNETAPFGTNVYYVRSVDANGNLSLSSNSVSVYIGYQTPIVGDLEASFSGNNVTLSWTVPDWCYPETESAILNYGNGNPYYSWTSIYYGHRHLAANLAQYAGKAVYKVSTFIQYPGTYSVYVYTNSTQYNRPDPNSLAFSKTNMQVTISNGWYEIDMNEPIILTGNNDLWIVMKQENTGQQYPTPSFNLTEHNTNAFYSGSISPTNLTDTGSNYNCSWFINVYLTDGTYTYNLYRNNTKIANNLNTTTYTATLSNNNSNLFSVKTNYYGGETEASNKIGFAKGNVSLSTLSLADNDQMTVLANSTITVNGALVNENAEHLVLEAGAQLVNNSNGVKATVKKNITAYTPDHNNGWHLIASPVTESITPSAGNGFLVNNYDLYTFDQSEELEWRNHVIQNFSIDNKAGYVYANSGSPTLEFQGTLTANATATTLVYDNNASSKGFNLIGNPYPCNAYVNRSFYILHETENGSEFTLGSGAIPPCTSILVQAQSGNESVIFSKTPSNKSGIILTLAQIEPTSKTLIDKAAVSVEESDQLVKYTVNANNPKLYIPQNGKDFAVAFTNGMSETPINFMATKNGTYILEIEVEGVELDYLHLIDNLTGDDIDLLVTPNYTFEAKATDCDSRFKLSMIIKQ